MLVDLIELMKNESFGFQTIVLIRLRNIKSAEALPHWSHHIYFQEFFAPSVDISSSFSLNGSDPEQMVHNKVGRLSLEVINTWNAIFDGVMWFFSYDKRSPRKYLQKHIKHIRDQRYQNIIYISILVTKESDNNMQDYNIISIW